MLADAGVRRRFAVFIIVSHSLGPDDFNGRSCRLFQIAVSKNQDDHWAGNRKRTSDAPRPQGKPQFKDAVVQMLRIRRPPQFFVRGQPLAASQRFRLIFHRHSSHQETGNVRFPGGHMGTMRYATTTPANVRRAVSMYVGRRRLVGVTTALLSGIAAAGAVALAMMVVDRYVQCPVSIRVVGRWSAAGARWLDRSSACWRRCSAARSVWRRGPDRPGFSA